VLVIVAITICLCALAVWAITRVINEAMGRLGLDPMSVMLWFGLAEWPAEPRLRRAHSSPSPRRHVLPRRRGRSRTGKPSGCS